MQSLFLPSILALQLPPQMIIPSSTDMSKKRPKKKSTAAKSARPKKTPPARPSKAPKSKKQEEFWDIDADPLTPSPPKRKKSSPAKKTDKPAPKKKSEKLKSDEQPTKKTKKSKPETTLEKTPTKPKRDTDDDFWDLGDDDLEIEETAKEQTLPKSKNRTKPSRPQSKPNTLKTSTKASEEKNIGQSKSKLKHTQLKVIDSTSTPKKEDDNELDLETPPSPQSPPQKQTYKSGEKVKTDSKLIRKSDSPKKPSKEVNPTTLFEKMSLLVLLACLLGALVWGISTFFDEAPQGDVISFIEEFPAKGEQITVVAVETWWRKPIRSGENTDQGIIIEAELIPCAKITLTDTGSTTLRVTFRDGDTELIGDTINLAVKNGRFTRNGSTSIEVYCTAGFEDASRIRSYANEDIAPWSLSIRESGTNFSRPCRRLARHAPLLLDRPQPMGPPLRKRKT